MKKLLLSIFTLSLLWLGTALPVVNPQPGQSVWTILSNLGQQSDEIEPTVIGDPGGGTYTISASGPYLLGEHATGQIVVDADDVCLSLGCHRLAQNDKDEDIVVVNSGKKRIRIHHGLLENTDLSAGARAGSGILVNSGAQHVKIHNVSVSNTGNGVKFFGVWGTQVTDCTVDGCTFIGTSSGGYFYYADRNRVRKCFCYESTQAGFGLLQSTDNCILDCVVVDTFGDQTTTAFISESGRSNLFKRCKAKNTQTEAWEFCNKAYGFLLTGTESKTKIIDCVVNETDMTSTVSAVAYGIHLDPMLLESSELLASTTLNDTPTSAVQSVAWSPDGRYVASGESGVLRVFKFDGTSLPEVATDSSISGNLYVDWSPNGKFLAVGDATNDSADLHIFQFDGFSLTKLLSADRPAGINTVKWSPDGNYIATGDASGDVYVLKRTWQSGSVVLAQVAQYLGSAVVYSVDWSPDGIYLVIGDSSAGGTVRVLSFTGNGLVSMGSSTAPSATVYSVTWSPHGRFIITGEGVAGSAPGPLRVFSFDESNFFEVDNISTPIIATTMWGVDWSPNGKYIVIGDSSSRMYVFSFDGSTLSQEKQLQDASASVFNAVAWSPCGNYIATAAGGGSVRLYDAMYGPASCLIKGNSVCDTNSFGQFIGTGIAGSVANNGIICNTCIGNEIDYTFGIPNVYDFLTTRTDFVGLADNLSC